MKPEEDPNMAENVSPAEHHDTSFSSELASSDKEENEEPETAKGPLHFITTGGEGVTDNADSPGVPYESPDTKKNSQTLGGNTQTPFEFDGEDEFQELFDTILKAYHARCMPLTESEEGKTPI